MNGSDENVSPEQPALTGAERARQHSAKAEAAKEKEQMRALREILRIEQPEIYEAANAQKRQQMQDIRDIRRSEQPEIYAAAMERDRVQKHSRRDFLQSEQPEKWSSQDTRLESKTSQSFEWIRRSSRWEVWEETR